MLIYIKYYIIYRYKMKRSSKGSSEKGSNGDDSPHSNSESESPSRNSGQSETQPAQLGQSLTNPTQHPIQSYHSENQNQTIELMNSEEQTAPDVSIFIE